MRTHINPCYLTKKIKSYVSDLINNNDGQHINYDDLPFSDKCEFAAYLTPKLLGKDGGTRGPD